MKYKVLLLSLVFIFVTMFVGCKGNNVTSENSVVSNNDSNNSSSGETVDNTSIYDKFINGEITAKTDEGHNLYINQFDFLDKEFMYAYYDVDSDNVDELCVKNTQIYVFDIKDDQLYNLYTETLAYSSLLNDGGFLHMTYGAEPDHIFYDYNKINQDGDVITHVDFSWWDAVNAEDSVTFYIGGKEVTKEEYDELSSKYLNIGEDKVIWNDINGENNTKTEYKNIYEELDATIEAEYEEALNNALSTADICDVHIEFESRWKAIADEYYNKLVKDEGLKPYIIELKADWEVYYDSQIENYRNIYSKVLEGGSLTGIVFSSKKCSLQKEWALQLIDIYTL